MRSLSLRDREKAGKIFYAMYPNFDARNWGYFEVSLSSGRTRVAVDYVTDTGTVHIIKGRNDKDPRWKKYLYPETPGTPVVSQPLGRHYTREASSEASKTPELATEDEEDPQGLDVGVLKMF